MNDVVLITGALGYVGGRVAQALANETDSPLRLASRRAVPQLPSWLPRGEMVTLDLLGDGDLERVCHKVKSIIHFAAMNDADCMLDPKKALQVNGIGTLRLLQAAQRVGVERFIYFSTAHIYGAPLVGLIDEKTLPRPAHPYAISHKTAEDFVLAAHDSGKLTGIVVRLSNGLGAPTHPAVNTWMLICNDLCRQAVISKELRLRSSGIQQRDFITLTDVSRAVMLLLDLAPIDVGDGLFNLGGGQAVRVVELAERIAGRCEKLFGYIPPIFRPLPTPGEKTEELRYITDKMRGVGFMPKGNFDEEIDATLRMCASAFGGDG